MYTNSKSLSKIWNACLVVLVVLQVTTFAKAQNTPPPGLTNYGLSPLDVSSKADDYIIENRRQYNATLESYINQINDVKESLEDELKVLDKQKVLLLNTIKETNERINPLEILSLPTKYCVQLYGSELPYVDIVKTNIESCITNARSYANSIVSTPSSYYNTLNNYYNTDLKNNLNNCVKKNPNPSLNYTLCVTDVISKANAYTITNRKNFATAIESSRCSVNARIDVAVSCSYTYVKSALTSVGAANRLIDNCINNYLNPKPIEPCVNSNGTVISPGCPNVIYVEVKDGEIANSTMARSLQQGTARSQDCLEIRYI